MRISKKKASLTPSFAEATVALGREALSRSTIATAAAVPVVQIKKASWTLAASMRKATAACCASASEATFVTSVARSSAV